MKNIIFIKSIINIVFNYRISEFGNRTIDCSINMNNGHTERIINIPKSIYDAIEKIISE